jgi:hypothetical protein
MVFAESTEYQPGSEYSLVVAVADFVAVVAVVAAVAAVVAVLLELGPAPI